MTELGFQRRAGDIYTIPITPDALGWVGFNKATRRPDGFLEVNPVIGIRQQTLENFLAELLGNKPHKYIPATITLSLGYTMPEERYRPWLFQWGSPVDEGVFEMTQCIKNHGIPYMERLDSLAKVVEAMEDGAGNNESNSYRLPAGYFLLGKPIQAKEALERAVNHLAGRHDMAADRFRSFASALGGRLETTSRG